MHTSNTTKGWDIAHFYQPTTAAHSESTLVELSKHLTEGTNLR